jgi:hypothetical protein
MKKFTGFFFAIFVVAALSSCKKDNSTGANIPFSYQNKIVITNLQTSNDSVVLTWTKLTNSRFYLYLVIRRNFKAADPTSFSYSDILEEIYDADMVRFVDHSFPLTSYLEYEVVGVLLDTTSSSYNYIYSNVRSYERPNLKTFYFNPTDVIPDIPNHRFYVIEADSGKINMVDYRNKTLLKSIKTYSTNGFCALGTYNGVKELYVPRNDGWLFIYNAETLTQIDQINAGTNCGAVVSNNGKLFVFGNSSYYYNNLCVIDRATKSVITTVNDLNYVRPRLIPGSNTKILGVSSSSSSSGYLYSFEFDANGILKSQDENYVSYPSDYHSFEIFPDGQHFITSQYGAIYTGALSYVIQLPYGNYNYSGFAFDSAASQILAGCRNYKNIVSYTNPGYTEQTTYHTSGYPAFIFTDNNSIISLSSSTSFSYYGYGHDFVIETIDLKK